MCQRLFINREFGKLKTVEKHSPNNKHFILTGNTKKKKTKRDDNINMNAFYPKI